MLKGKYSENVNFPLEVRYEGFLAMKIQVVVFWVVMSYSDVVGHLQLPPSSP